MSRSSSRTKSSSDEPETSAAERFEDAVADAEDEPRADQIDPRGPETPPPGQASRKAARTVIPTSDERGRRVLTTGNRNEDGTRHYIEVETFGDPDLYASYQVRPIDGRDDWVDVCINGDWKRLHVDQGPLRVHRDALTIDAKSGKLVPVES